MAENLAWLPEMKNSYNSSATEPYYYVYGYTGFNLDEAKAESNNGPETESPKEDETEDQDQRNEDEDGKTDEQDD